MVALSESNCSKYKKDGKIQEGYPRPNENGSIFYEGSTEGAAAGNRSRDFFYHVFQNGKCFEIQQGLRMTGLGRIGVMKPVNSNAVLVSDDVVARLEEILYTFKFTN